MAEERDRIKLLIVIPTKGDRNSLNLVLECVNRSMCQLLSLITNFDYEIIVAVNNQNNVAMQDRLIDVTVCANVKVIETFPPGKVNAIIQVCKDRAADFILTLDDDVIFERDAIFKAFHELIKNTNVELVGYQSKIIPFSGTGVVNKFIYDTINIKLLRSLYKGVDPFLFGRFILIRGSDYPVPKQYIVDDIFLSLYYSDKFVILPDYVYTSGVGSLRKHLRRVIVLESARRQAKRLNPSRWETNHKQARRQIDLNKLRGENFYYKTCYFSYVILRFFTNKILAPLVTHTKVSW